MPPTPFFLAQPPPPLPLYGYDSLSPGAPYDPEIRAWGSEGGGGAVTASAFLVPAPPPKVPRGGGGLGLGLGHGRGNGLLVVDVAGRFVRPASAAAALVSKDQQQQIQQQYDHQGVHSSSSTF